MFKLIVSCLVFLIPVLTSAFAPDLAGKWQSTQAEAYNNSGWRAKCKPLALNISQHGKDFGVALSSISCKELNSEAYSVVFQIRQSLVYLNGMRVGSFGKKGFQARFPLPSKAILTLVITKDSNRLHYKEQLSSGNAAIVLDAVFNPTR